MPISSSKIQQNLPFLKAKNSKTLWTMETTNVSASKYGLVSNIVRCQNEQYQS